MPNGTYGGVRGQETKVGQKTSFPDLLDVYQLHSALPRRGKRTVDRAIRLSLDEEAVRRYFHLSD